MIKESELQIKKIYVELFHFEENFEYISEKEKMSIGVSVIPKISLDNDNYKKGKVGLEIELFDENFKKENKPFYLKLFLVMFVEDTNTDDELDVFEKYLPNAISMAYSYARSYIAGVTGIIARDSIRIPTINIFELLSVEEP